MFSLVALFGKALHPEGKVPVQRTAWYDKKEATFADVLGVVRRQLWGNFTFQASPQDPDVCLVPRSYVERLAYAVCYWGMVCSRSVLGGIIHDYYRAA